VILFPVGLANDIRGIRTAGLKAIDALNRHL
jgi:hypothetical protein